MVDVKHGRVGVLRWKNRRPSSTEARSAEGSLWYSASRLCECGRNSGVKELREAEECRHTLLGGVLEERFSWCLSRRLRKRETPELFMVVGSFGDTHAGRVERAASGWGVWSRGRQRVRRAMSNEAGGTVPYTVPYRTRGGLARGSMVSRTRR